MSELAAIPLVILGIAMLFFVMGFTDIMEWISKKLWNHPDR